MKRIRVIPVLLVSNGGLYKTIKFSKPNYIGDPINAVKIFNDKEVDEIVVLDIAASLSGKEPNFNYIQEFASEAFMPLGYGGGVTTFDQAQKLFNLGVEKVIINSSAAKNPGLIGDISKYFGAQSAIASIDYKNSILGKQRVFSRSGKYNTKNDVVTYAKRMEDVGAGEIILNSISRDGTRTGYDLDTIKLVSEAVNIPVVACGGANSVADMKKAVINAGASAVAAGSMFVYRGDIRSILINYPTQKELTEGIYSHL